MRLSHSQNALVLGCSEPPLPGEANIATSLTGSFTLRFLACGIDGLPALATARSKFQTGKPECHALIPRMSTVAEIESALKELPLEEAQKLSQWLQGLPPAA
jgi:hypothetical protein